MDPSKIVLTFQCSIGHTQTCTLEEIMEQMPLPICRTCEKRHDREDESEFVSVEVIDE